MTRTTSTKKRTHFRTAAHPPRTHTHTLLSLLLQATRPRGMKTAKQARVMIPLGMLENEDVVLCAPPPSMLPGPSSRRRASRPKLAAQQTVEVRLHRCSTGCHTVARSLCLRKKRSICMGQPQVRNERGGAVGQEDALEVHGCEVAVHMQSVLSGAMCAPGASRASILEMRRPGAGCNVATTARVSWRSTCPAWPCRPAAWLGT